MDGQPSLSLPLSLLFTDAYMWPSFANGAGERQDGGGVEKEEESEGKKKRREQCISHSETIGYPQPDYTYELHEPEESWM